MHAIYCIHRRPRVGCTLCAARTTQLAVQSVIDEMTRSGTDEHRIKAMRAALEDIARMCETGYPPAEIHKVARVTLKGTA